MDQGEALALALQRVRNLESAVAFMQREHGATLTGLHGEIARLQGRCADLTFQLALKEDIMNSEQVGSEVVLRFERDLSLLHARNGALERAAKESDSKIDELEKELSAQRRRHKEQLQRRDATIARLGNELEERARTIARLTAQIQRAGPHGAIEATDGPVPASSTRHPGYRHAAMSVDSHVHRRARVEAAQHEPSHDDDVIDWSVAALMARPPEERPASARRRPSSAASLGGSSRPTSARFVPPLPPPNSVPDAKYGVLPPINPSAVWAVGGRGEDDVDEGSTPLPPPTPPPGSSGRVRRVVRARADGMARLSRESSVGDAVCDDALVNSLSTVSLSASRGASGMHEDAHEGVVRPLGTADAKKAVASQPHRS